MRGRTVVALIAVSLALPACPGKTAPTAGTAPPTVTNPTGASPSPADTGGWKTWRSKDLGVSMVFPPTWKQGPAFCGGTEFDPPDARKGVPTTMLTACPGEGWVTGAVAGRSAREIGNARAQNLSSGRPQKYADVELTDVTVGDVPAVRLDYIQTAKSANKEVRWAEIIGVRGKESIWVAYAAPTADFEAHLPEAEAMFASLKYI